MNSLSPFDASVKPKKKQPGTPGRIFKEESEGSPRMRIKRAAEFEENRNPDGSCKNMYNFSLAASGKENTRQEPPRPQVNRLVDAFVWPLPMPASLRESDCAEVPRCMAVVLSVVHRLLIQEFNPQVCGVEGGLRFNRPSMWVSAFSNLRCHPGSYSSGETDARTHAHHHHHHHHHTKSFKTCGSLQLQLHRVHIVL